MKDDLVAHFQHIEDPNKVWHVIQGLVQGENELVNEYVMMFSVMWEQMCLEPEKSLPAMMKKD